MIEASFDVQLLKDTTVVTSSLSFAGNDLNAIEALIERLALKKIGIFFSPNLQPLLFQHSAQTACDVYQNLEAYPGLTVICIRSRIVGMSEFMSQLDDLFARVGANMFMLSSLASLFCSVNDGSEVARLRTRGLNLTLNDEAVKSLNSADEMTGCGLLRYVVDNHREIRCIAVTASGPDMTASQLLVRATLAALQVDCKARDA